PGSDCVLSQYSVDAAVLDGECAQRIGDGPGCGLQRGPVCRSQERLCSSKGRGSRECRGGRRGRWRGPWRCRGRLCPCRSAGWPECGKIVFRRIPMRVKWLLSLTSC